MFKETIENILFNHNPSPMYLYDIDTLDIVYVNKAAANQYGYTKEEFETLSLTDIHPPDQHKFLEQTLAGIPTYSGNAGVWKHQAKDGSEFYVEILAEPFQYKGQNLKLVQARDLSHLMNKGELKQRGLTGIQYHLANIPLGIVEWNRQLQVKNISKRITEITGYEPWELLGVSAFELASKLVVEDELKTVNEKIEELAIGSVIKNKFKLRLYTKDRHIATTKWYNSALRDHENRLISIMSFVEDLTDQVQARQDLKKEKEKFRLFEEISSDFISRHKPDGTFLYASPSIKKMLGYSTEEVIGKNVYDFFHPEDVPAIEKSHQIILQSENEYVVQYRFRTKKGSYKWVEATSKAIRNPDSNEIIQIQASIRDVSDRKKLEDKLISEKQFIRTAIESLPGIFYMIDEDQKYVMWNRNFETILGYSSEEIREIHPLAFYREEDHELIMAKIDEVFETGEVEVEVDLFNKSGKPIRHYITGRVFENEGKKYVVGSGINISKRVKAEKQLWLHEKLLTSLVENAPIGIIRLDSENRIINANKSFQEIFQYSNEEMKGKIIDSLLIPEDLSLVQEETPHSYRSKAVSKAESLYVKKDGTKVPVLIGTVPVYIESQFITSYVMYVDITDRKEYEKELRQTIHEKHVLLLEIHHRVKNNLAVISGLLELQKFQADNPDINKILSESQLRIKSIALIHDKLYLSNSLSHIEMNQVLEELALSARLTLDPEEKINIRVNCSPLELNINQAVPCSLIINELISYILEHSFTDKENGQIDLNVNQSDGSVLISVKDNGKGLTADFFKEETDSLGSAIIKALINQLKASLSIDKKDKSVTIVFKIMDIKGSSSSVVDLG